MSDVPMHPQPPSNDDGFFGRPEPDFDDQSLDGGAASDEHSWLLDTEGDSEGSEVHSQGGPSHEEVHALPGEFSEREESTEAWLDVDADDEVSEALDPIEGVVDGLVAADPALGASFVEPEAASRAFSRALVPAGAALLLSFSGIAVWAFVKKPATGETPVDIQVAAPDVVDVMEGSNVELVLPPGAADPATTGRVSFRRDGTSKIVGGQARPRATVKSPREPDELPPAGEAAVVRKNDDERPSFSAFGAGMAAAVTPKETLEVETTDEEFDAVAMNAARDFDQAIDPDVADEVLDAFGGLEDDMFLPQSFIDSFVLSIDPIDDIASIYGDVDTRDEVDSFADLGFAPTMPFDVQGFGNFGVAQWEGPGVGAQLADAADDAEFEFFLPFGMFEDEVVASVNVGPDESVAAVSTEFQELAEEDVPAGELALEEPSVEEGPVDEVAESMAEDLLELAALFEMVEQEPVAEGETEEGIASADGAEAREPEIVAEVEVVAEVAPEVAADVDPAMEPELDPETDSELDLAAAHARLDMMFGPVQPPEETPMEEVAVLSAEPSADLAVGPEMGPEVGPEAEIAPELSEVFPAPVELEAIEPMAVAEIEVPLEVPVEDPVEDPVEMVTEAPSVPVLEVPVGPTVAEAEVTAREPAMIEVLDNIADDQPSGRRTSALRRLDDANVWKNRTVPKSKLAGDQFVLTPNVGNVRVIFDGGESVEGRLHGVGAQKIVLDTKLGRMTLDSRRAERIDRLGGGRRSELRSPSDSKNSIKGLDRVKVRAAGGVFYGHLVAQTDEKVTLLLDSGVRVTLDSTEIELATARRSTSRMRRR